MLTNILALDVGRARIGVALANDIARIASPLPAVANGENVYAELATLATTQQASRIVVGWPRNLSGEETEQTRYVDAFIAALEKQTGLPVSRQDEAVTSLQAEAELTARGKQFAKGDVDSLSAVYILEDYLQEGVH